MKEFGEKAAALENLSGWLLNSQILKNSLNEKFADSDENLKEFFKGKFSPESESFPFKTSSASAKLKVALWGLNESFNDLLKLLYFDWFEDDAKIGNFLIPSPTSNQSKTWKKSTKKNFISASALHCNLFRWCNSPNWLLERLCCSSKLCCKFAVILLLCEPLLVLWLLDPLIMPGISNSESLPDESMCLSPPLL